MKLVYYVAYYKQAAQCTHQLNDKCNAYNSSTISNNEMNEDCPERHHCYYVHMQTHLCSAKIQLVIYYGTTIRVLEIKRKGHTTKCTLVTPEKNQAIPTPGVRWPHFKAPHFTLVKEALIEIGCVVTSLVVTRVHCSQTVHRPIVTMEH